MIRKTVLISLYSLLWSFPIPMILSFIIHQLRFHRFKRIVQAVFYAPHFISVMVVFGIIRIFLSPSSGLLNLILGTLVDFLTQSSGTIYIASSIWQDARWGCIIYLTTLANVDPGLYKAAKIDGASVFQRILNVDIPELLPVAILDIMQFLDRKPKAMSGGQRVAIGPAIVWELKVLLMSEPLSNLDAKLRNQTRAEIIKLRQKIYTMFIDVTHDQTEAMTLGDRIVIMKDGYVQQVGTPQMNFFDANLIKEGSKYFAAAEGCKLSPEKEAALGRDVVVIAPTMDLNGSRTDASF